MRGLEDADIIDEGGAFESMPLPKGCVPSIAAEREECIPPACESTPFKVRNKLTEETFGRIGDIWRRPYRELHAVALDCPSKDGLPLEVDPTSCQRPSSSLVRAYGLM